MFAALPKLKLLITSGMRNAAIDMEAARDTRVVVCGTRAAGDPTAALTMGLILELTRKIGRENARMHAGEPCRNTLGIEIEGRTLGVIGLGKLGSQGRGAGESVRDERHSVEPQPHAGAMPGSRRRLCQQTGTVRNRRHHHHPYGVEPAFPWTGRPRGTGANETERLSGQHRAWSDRRRSRAAGSLAARKIAGAAIDVFSVEPLPVDHPFRKLDNIVLTPHLGYVTEESFRSHYGQMVEGIDAWLTGGPLQQLA